MNILLRTSVLLFMAITVVAIAAPSTRAMAATCSTAGGDHYADKGMLKHAVVAYSAVLQKPGCGKDTHVLFQRARVYFAAGRFEKAAQDFAAVVGQRPTWSKAQAGLAWSLFKTSSSKADLLTAEAAALEAIRLNPSDHYAWHTLGSIQEKLERPLYTFVRAYRTAWQMDSKKQKGWDELIKLNAIFDWSSIA